MKAYNAVMYSWGECVGKLQNNRRHYLQIRDCLVSFSSYYQKQTKNSRSFEIRTPKSPHPQKGAARSSSASSWRMASWEEPRSIVDTVRIRFRFRVRFRVRSGLGDRDLFINPKPNPITLTLTLTKYYSLTHQILQGCSHNLIGLWTFAKHDLLDLKANIASKSECSLSPPPLSQKKKEEGAGPTASWERATSVLCFSFPVGPRLILVRLWWGWGLGMHFCEKKEETHGRNTRATNL